MIEISPDVSIPHHCESIPLRSRFRILGATIAALGLLDGFALVAVAEGIVAEVVGPLLVIIGALALWGVVRCRTCRVTVGTLRTETNTGPFTTMVPTGAVESTTLRPATSWRRLFADEEVVLQVSVGSGELAVPSTAPVEIVAALKELR